MNKQSIEQRKELSIVEDTLVGLRFKVANSPIDKDGAIAIKNAALSIIGQAREIEHTCEQLLKLHEMENESNVG